MARRSSERTDSEPIEQSRGTQQIDEEADEEQRQPNTLRQEVSSGYQREESEDLFLSLARDTVESQGLEPAVGRTERRRSRLTSANYQPSAPSITSGAAANQTSSSRDHSPEGPALPLQNHRIRAPRPTPRKPTRTDELRERTLSPQISEYGRRRTSNTESTQIPPTRNHAYHSPKLMFSNLHTSTSNLKQSSPGGTNSVVSTAAPSIVWDELDDLKSRIKNLELTGKLPPTSGAMVPHGFNDQPQTAPTTVTTVSSQPKYDRTTMLLSTESTVGGPAATNLHPLLHAALAKVRTLVSPPLYRTLEATAADALALVAMTGGAGPQGTHFTAASILNGVTISDRHIRRKADNMCRNLTDLCIALCDGNSNPSTSAFMTPLRPGSRATSSNYGSKNQNHPSPNYAKGRHFGREPEDSPPSRSAPSRALSRVEARRSSMLGMSSNVTSTREVIPATPGHQSTTPTQQLPRSSERQTRSGTDLLRSRRLSTEAGRDEYSISRAPSRATTEAGQTASRPIPQNRQRVSNDFASRHHSPEQQHSPTLRELLAARRQNGTVQLSNSGFSSSSPLTRSRYHDHATSTSNGEQQRQSPWQPSTTSPGQHTSSARNARERSEVGRVGGLAPRRSSNLAIE
ncbi:hypothetical protein BJ546DRAFT_954466 [Cryomyces antarcticus]